MAVIVGEAAVRLRPETSTFASEADAEVSGSLPPIAKKAAAFFAAAFAAEKVGEFLKESVTQASDLSESTSKVQVVFGDASKSVLDFASNSAAAFGQSKGQALEAAGTFGNLLRSLGLGAQASADMSTKFVGLASDLASFNNTDPAQALEALRSGLTGETEPLKQYGINLNQAAIKQQALKMGLDASGPTLSASVQAQAAYALILQQSSLAQGDFSRTASGLANQQRIMASQWTDLHAQVGAILVPFVQLGAHVLTGVVLPALLNLTRPLAEVGTALGEFGQIVQVAFTTGDASGLIGQLTGAGKAVGMLAQSTAFLGAQFVDAFHGGDVALAEQAGGLSKFSADAGQEASYLSALWSDAWTAFTVGGSNLGASESAVIAFATNVGTSFRLTRQSIVADWDSVKAATLDAASPSLMQGLAVQWDSLKAGAGQALSGVADTVKGAFSGVGGAISGALGGALGGLGGGAGGITDKIVGMIGDLAPKVLPLVTGVVDRLLGIFQQVAPVVGQVFGAIGPVVASVVGTIGPLIGQLVPVFGQVIEAVRAVSGIWTTVLMGAIQQLLPVLPVIVQAIATLVTGIVSGLGPVIASLVPVIAQVAGIVVQLVSTFEQGLIQAIGQLVPIIPPLVTALLSVGQAIIGALVQALQALMPALPPIVSALSLVAQALMGALMGAINAILPIIPQLIDVIITLVQSAITPLLPLLPTIANLFATIAPILATLLAQLIAGLAPILPVVVQLAAMIIQLAVSALMPLMPVIVIVVNLLVMLVQALVPIIQIVITVAGAFLQGFMSVLSVVIGVLTTIISTAIGFVSTILSIFTGIIGAVTGIFGAIFGVISSVWNGIFGFISGIVTKVASFIGGVFSGVGSAISGVFSGIGNAISDVFSGAVGVVKKVINTIIGAINWAIDFINDKLIDTANKVPFVNIPHIPHIPTLHEGGYFESHSQAGEGLALLRDRELVATPEQQTLANDLLSRLLSGRLDTATGAPTPAGTGAGVTVVNNVTQQPGEDGSVLAARVTQGVVWNLNAGITRRVGVAAEVAP